ncbi:hypothetical protein Dimus_031145 [Dionaea muscipula]
MRNDWTFVTSEAEIGGELIDYYVQILGTVFEGGEQINTDFVNDGPVLTEEHKRHLNADFSIQDVKRALAGIQVNTQAGQLILHYVDRAVEFHGVNYMNEISTKTSHDLPVLNQTQPVTNSD